MKRFVSAFAVVLVATLLLGCTGQQSQQQPQGGYQGGQGAQQGRMAFTVTDAAADMGAVSSVKVTIDSVQVKSSQGAWATLSTSPQTYDLLQLKASGSQALLADASLASGTYDQVRLHVSKVVVADASGEHEAKLPSENLRISGQFEAKANSTTTVMLDFIADRSLHVTGNGKYILAPVIRVQERADTEVDASNRADVRVMGGRIKSDVEVGMDVDGNVGVGLGIPASAIISIGNSGNVLIWGGSNASASGNGRLVVGIKDAAADMGAVTSVKMTVDSVEAHSDANGWVAVSSAPKTYDLVQLKASGQAALAAEAQLPEGSYQQLRFKVSKVVVADASGEHEAKLPSGEIRVNAESSVRAGSTTTATFDFIASESLHTAAGSGKYVFAPVMRVETREDASAEARGDGTVAVGGGTVKTDAKFGMDLDGNVGVGISVPSNVNIIVDSDSKLKIGILS